MRTDTPLIERLIDQTQELAHGQAVQTIHVRAGALSNVSPQVLSRRLCEAMAGTALEGADVEFKFGHDPLADDALRVFVTHVDLAE